MKTSKLILLLVTLLVLAGAGLFVHQYSLPDINKIRKDVVERTLTIDGLDSNINELAIRNRFNLDLNYDALTRSTSLLDKATDDLEKTYFANQTSESDLLARRFFEYKNELEVKKGLIENFKTHNSVLRNSEKYAPQVGRELMQIAQKENLAEASAFYAEIIRELLDYSLQGSSITLENLKLKLAKLAEIEAKMPESALTEAIAFSNHLNTVIREKDETDTYLRKIMLSTTDNSLAALTKAWNEQMNVQTKAHEFHRMLVMVYIGFLLITLLFIVWKLKGLYQSLDKKVLERTKEARDAYQELKEYETQLIQSEKMASLGQLVAGVAHEVNTPLGYITSNVETIRSGMSEQSKLLTTMDQISNEVSEKTPNGKRLSTLLRAAVNQYRQMGKKENLDEIEDLLKDSAYGLNEISNLVISLKDYSRMDKDNMSNADINEGLNTTLKICKNIIGQRKIEKNYDENLPQIECLPAQINQVFLNVINNAAQATSEDTGVISVSTINNGDTIGIIIHDNGYGMDEETLKHIFDPFFTTKEVGQGTGLGMSISYKIISSHKGEIDVSSLPGQGTTIKITLPLKQ